VLKLWSKALTQFSRWAGLLIKLKTQDSRIFANMCGNTDSKLCKASLRQALCWISFTQCHDFAPAKHATPLYEAAQIYFFPTGVSELAKRRERCVPPCASQPVIASTKYLALQMIKVIVMGKGNIFKSWELWTRTTTRYLNHFLMATFPVFLNRINSPSSWQNLTTKY